MKSTTVHFTTSKTAIFDTYNTTPGCYETASKYLRMLGLLVVLPYIIAPTTTAYAETHTNKKKHVAFEFPAEKYEQQFVVIFKDAEAANKASIDILALYNGYNWAISSRWDDNNKSDLKMRDVLAKHGHKATWYLNSVDIWRNFASTGRALLKGGNSIGGHSLTHPYLTYVNRNRIFEEVAGIRAQWEAAADTLVVSYAFSFCDFHNAMEGDDVQIDIDHALQRAGYYNIVNQRYHNHLDTDMIISPIMPCDGQDIDDFAEGALKNKLFQKQHPNLSYAMHVWYKTPQAWEKFERQLDKYANNPKWWYCNQNEYAAYRYQFLHSKLYLTELEGNTKRMRIERPALWDLNNSTPLTLRVKGIPREDVISVKCATADCLASDRKTDYFLFHLYHDRHQKLPKKIGIICNEHNRRTLTKTDENADFPQLKSLLYLNNGQLHLVIDNQSNEPVENIRITYRLPLAFGQGVVRRKIKDISAGTRREEKLTPALLNGDYKYNAGISFFLAQIDFTQAEQPGRIYTTCRAINDVKDHSYPQGGFLKLGPIHKQQLNLEKLVSEIKSGGTSTELWSRPWKLPDNTTCDWSADHKDSPSEEPYLNVEVIRTFGSWLCREPLTYILQTSLHSDHQQSVKFRYDAGIQYVFLNGEDVTNRTAHLRKGDNALVLVSGSGCKGKHRDYRAEHAGSFLRLVEPDTGKRLTDIRFEPKKVKLKKTEAFQPCRLQTQEKSVNM